MQQPIGLYVHEKGKSPDQDLHVRQATIVWSPTNNCAVLRWAIWNTEKKGYDQFEVLLTQGIYVTIENDSPEQH